MKKKKQDPGNGKEPSKKVYLTNKGKVISSQGEKLSKYVHERRMEIHRHMYSPHLSHSNVKWPTSTQLSLLLKTSTDAFKFHHMPRSHTS